MVNHPRIFWVKLNFVMVYFIHTQFWFGSDIYIYIYVFSLYNPCWILVSRHHKMHKCIRGAFPFFLLLKQFIKERGYPFLEVSIEFIYTTIYAFASAASTLLSIHVKLLIQKFKNYGTVRVFYFFLSQYFYCGKQYRKQGYHLKHFYFFYLYLKIHFYFYVFHLNHFYMYSPIVLSSLAL